MRAFDDDELEALLTAVAGGDRNSFARLYGLTSPLLHAVCLRLVREREVAKEVLQEAFVRVWQRAGTFDPRRGAATGWLIAVARRCAFDRLRRPGEHGVTTPLEEIPSEHPMLATNPVDPAVQDVRRCLQALRTEVRRVVTLAFVYGLSHAELADHCQAPLGTVKSWIRRGLLDLRDCLEG